MFDVTPEEISQLNDVDLRELVGRLCEAELSSRGLSSAAVTWGGNQTAADGGLDVRVALKPGTAIDGFIPRASTGFQVKTPDMARAAILSEMRPKGDVRAVIQELADEAGSYVIVSSHGSTADSALRNRRAAMREALKDVASADKLETDFYDRTRLAAWVRRHPGIITWVKERVGRSVTGWRAYGAWSNATEEVGSDYLLDDKLRLRLGNHYDESARSVVDAIDDLRDQLTQIGKVVRLVGLSGVGKTRLVQALFDDRIGSRPLPPSLAVYTDLSDNPNPQPTGLASDLVANRTRAILIVDNCPPDLHRRLSGLCAGYGSSLSVLTVEYDVRDDQPEGTQVVTLDTSSPELIKKLVARRYPHLSEVGSYTIAEASGGNARIAIALARTVERSESISGLSDDELFQRLFRQRHDSNDALLRAAQACALVYSFEGEALADGKAELPRLALLANQTPEELYRHISELLHRDLIQQRGVWRAVLPHAIANRLAARALDDLHVDHVNEQLVARGSERLARSFSRRLSFLHQHPKAIAIVEQWLAPGGLLGDVANFNDLGRAMFENAAPVSPEATLRAIERGRGDGSEVPAVLWNQYRSLLRSLAYDPTLFERSCYLLVQAATQNEDIRGAKEVSETFVSLFTIHLSGTHATTEQRLRVIENLLRSEEPRRCALGLKALDKFLEAMHFGSFQIFEFGARSRDYGYQPKSSEDVTQWYDAALVLIERMALTEGILKSELRDMLAQNFRGLWITGRVFEELEKLTRRFGVETFWREGWMACRQTIRFDQERLTLDGALRLAALEADLRPSNLQDRVRAFVLGDTALGLDLELEDVELDGDAERGHKRLDAIATELGSLVVLDEVVFVELMPDLLRGGSRAWAFGCGLARGAQDRRATWTRLEKQLEELPSEHRSIQVLRGYLAELWQHERELAQELLDAAFERPALIQFIPVLQLAAELDTRGIDRLKLALKAGLVPVRMYRDLAFGRATDQLTGSDLSDLLFLIMEQADGIDVALEILSMRFFSDRSEKRKHEPKLLHAGREILLRARLGKGRQRDDYSLAELTRSCLVGPEAGPLATEVVRRLKQAVGDCEVYAPDHDGLLKALLGVQPIAVLDALFEGSENGRNSDISVFDYLYDHRSNPIDEVSCQKLIDWCDDDRNSRYLLAASFVTFARRSDESEPAVWSEQALALISHSPDPTRTLTVFIERFQPMSWSGSRAVLMETNARLLDDLEGVIPMQCMSFVAEAKVEIAREIARERDWEVRRDRERDERFE